MRQSATLCGCLSQWERKKVRRVAHVMKFYEPRSCHHTAGLSWALKGSMGLKIQSWWNSRVLDMHRESHINPLYNEFISIPLLCPSFYSFDIPPMQVTYGWNGIYRNYAEIWQMLFHLCLLQASPDAKPDPKIAQAAEAAASLDEWFSWGLRHRSGWWGRVDRSSASWKKMKTVKF